MKRDNPRGKKPQPHDSSPFAWMVGAYAIDLGDANAQTYVALLALTGLRITLHALPTCPALSVLVTNGGVFGQAEKN